MTVSLWQRREPAPRRIEADITIVGGGISGLSGAIECEARGLRVCLIEQDFIGSRASGRNAGFLMRGAAENYALACENLGRDAARVLWKWTEDNLLALRRLGAGSLPGFADRASCLVALGEAEADELDRSAALMREDGFETALVRPGPGAPDDAVWRRGRPLVGLLNPNDAVCSPMELVGLLRSRLNRTEVVTGARVYGIEPFGNGGGAGGVPGSGRVLVRARGFDVESARVLVCTNAYARELIPELASVVEPNRGQMLAFRPEDPDLARLHHAYYLNRGSEYIRSGPGGVVVFGGARRFREAEERTDLDGLNPAVQAELERLVGEFVTDRYEVVARWSGIMGFSPDGLPVMRAVDPGWGGPPDGRVWFCGGLTGHGMSMGHIAARHAVRAMFDGAENPFGR